MKKVFFLATLALAASSSFAQIANGNFEQWETLWGTTVQNPKNFVTSNLDFYDDQPASVLPINGKSGKGASILSYMYNDGSDSFPNSGFIMSGSLNLMTGTFNQKIPVNGKPSKFKGYYHYLPAGNDYFEFSVVLFKEGVPVALASWEDGAATNGFESFEIPFNYNQNTLPDSAMIAIRSSSDNHEITPGTILNIDELEFEMETPNAINHASAVSLTAFPNPCAQEVHIQLPEVMEAVRYEVISASGKTVMMEHAVLGGNSVSIATSELPVGTYFVQLSSNTYHGHCKILVVR